MTISIVGASKPYVRELIASQIERGKRIDADVVPLSISIQAARLEEEKWDKFVLDLLARFFDSHQFYNEFGEGADYTQGIDNYAACAFAKLRLRLKVSQLESIYERTDLLAEVPLASPSGSITHGQEFVALHPLIAEKCERLYGQRHYGEAVELSFKIVRDRLRALTGYEKGSDAFGRTNLHITGAVASHVDEDFNEGVKFLCMSIDKFRNEKSHTSNAEIRDPVRAHQYLVLSSLALTLLENAELTEN